MPLSQKIVSMERFMSSTGLSEEEIEKAAEGTMKDSPFILGTQGKYELFYEDAYLIFTAPYLKKQLRLTWKQISKIIDENDLHFDNNSQIVRIQDDGFTSVKLRLNKFKGHFIGLMDRGSS